MYYLIYMSTATRLLSDDDLKEVLATSRTYNLTYNITGILLYSDGIFIQLLEGDEQAVTELFVKKIKNDTRHKNIIEVVTGDTNARSFPDWSMGFMAPKAEELKTLQGYINPQQINLERDEAPPLPLTILKTFVENNSFTA
ncbi:BLUF domain-containing protein [Mucilaginibacter gynuensis]|uniref:BLUF domain-containing protein n=1 Tax=Mucilaginibacter gynuensis TaxID=1302236 RepID=A0ABP8HKW2_9SPHI